LKKRRPHSAAEERATSKEALTRPARIAPARRVTCPSKRLQARVGLRVYQRQHSGVKRPMAVMATARSLRTLLRHRARCRRRRRRRPQLRLNPYLHPRPHPRPHRRRRRRLTCKQLQKK
jgi:hypothetical protein